MVRPEKESFRMKSSLHEENPGLSASPFEPAERSLPQNSREPGVALAQERHPADRPDYRCASSKIGSLAGIFLFRPLVDVPKY